MCLKENSILKVAYYAKTDKYLRLEGLCVGIISFCIPFLSSLIFWLKDLSKDKGKEKKRGWFLYLYYRDSKYPLTSRKSAVSDTTQVFFWSNECPPWGTVGERGVWVAGRRVGYSSAQLSSAQLSSAQLNSFLWTRKKNPTMLCQLHLVSFMLMQLQMWLRKFEKKKKVF